MTSTIIPLRPKREEASAFAHVDTLAAALLAEGRAASLSAARIDVTLQRLHAQRAELAALVADLQTRPPTGDNQVDAINASLVAGTQAVISQVDLFIQQAHNLREKNMRPQPVDLAHHAGIYQK